MGSLEGATGPHPFPWWLQTYVDVHSRRVWPQCSYRMCPATLLQTFATECPKESSKGNVSAAPSLYSILGLELHVHTLYRGTSQVLPPQWVGCMMVVNWVS